MLACTLGDLPYLGYPAGASTDLARVEVIDSATQLQRLARSAQRLKGSSFSGLLTRVEIGHIRIGSAGNGRIRSPASGSSLSQRV